MRTPKGIVSYPNVFKARLNDMNGKKEFTMDLLMSKDDPEVKTFLKDIKDYVNAKFDGKPPKTWRNPVKDGDEKFTQDQKKNAIYENKYYFTAKANEDQPPRVFEFGTGKELTSQEEFYGGCIAQLSVNPWFYDNMGNKGVTLYFGKGIVKIDDGEKLGGGGSCDDDFEGFFNEADTQTSEIDDLLG